MPRDDQMEDMFEGGFREPPSEPVETSEAAARDARPMAGTQRRLLYDVIENRRTVGATDDELEELTGLSHHTVSPRRRELVLAGLVRDSGYRRPTRTGRTAIVWELGLDLDPGQDRGGPMVQVPNKGEILLALKDMRRLWLVARQAGCPVENLQEMRLVGRWLRALAGEELEPREPRPPMEAPRTERVRSIGRRPRWLQDEDEDEELEQ